VNLLDRHVARRILAAYGFFVGALIVVFVLLHFVEYVDNFTEGGATIGEMFLVYYPNAIPDIVRVTSPLAFFLAVVFTIGRMAQSFQVMALSAAGVPVRRLLVPALITGALVTAALFVVGGYVVPATQQTVLRYDERYLAEETGSQTETTNLFRQNTPGGFVLVGSYDPDSRTGYDVTFARYDRTRLAEVLVAGQMTNDSAAASDRWRLTNATRRVFDADGGEARTSIAQLDTTLNLGPRDLARSSRDVEALPLPEARAYLDAVARTGSGALFAPLTAYYDRFAYPVAHLVLALLACPLAARRRRGGQAVQIALGLLLATLYLTVQKLTQPFGATGRIDPALAAWLPHVPFLLLGVWMNVRARA